MSPSPKSFFALAFAALAGLNAPPVVAASSAASSASESVGVSIGSLSGSVQKSSDSSSRTTQVATGDYRIVEVTQVADKPGVLRLTLQALAPPADGEFFLYLPQATVADSRLAAGQTVGARQRPYGLEFSGGPAGAPFFLVLADDWYRELKSERVTS